MRLNLSTPLIIRHPLATRGAALVLLALTFVVLTGLLDGGVGVTPLRLLVQPLFPLANAWPGLLLAALLLVWTRRALFSFAVAFALQGVVYAVNALKIVNLGTPLLPSDFRMVGQLRRGGMHVLSAYVPDTPWLYLGLAAVLGLAVALWRFEPPLLPRRTGHKRTLAGGILALTLLSVLVGSSAWRYVYNGRVLWMEPWSAAATSNHSGLVSSLLMFRLQFAKPKAKPDRMAAQALITEFSPELQHSMQSQATGTELPDIIVVQSESFFDPRIVRGFQHSDLIPNLQRLAAYGMSGELHVPTFGGGTIRTEFEVLTGLSLRYFEDLQFPYLQMSHKSVPGLVRTLKAHGYETIAVHGNDPAFWNRTAAFKALGFDRFVSKSAFPANAPKDGKYMADSALIDEIKAQLKDSGPPQFVFAISIEAHGPYDVEPANEAERDAISVPAGITGKDKRELQTYLYHLRHADAELGRLVQWLAERNRPSRLLFYGDHLPGLADVYAQTGFVDGRDMLNQADVWLFVDPHATQRAPTRADTASWLLPATLLSQIGIHDGGYFALAGLAGTPLADLTKAPGAIPPTEDGSTLELDRRMRSVSLLHMSGKLASFLPSPLLQSSSDVAHKTPEAPAPATHSIVLP